MDKNKFFVTSVALSAYTLNPLPTVEEEPNTPLLDETDNEISEYTLHAALIVTLCTLILQSPPNIYRVLCITLSS